MENITYQVKKMYRILIHVIILWTGRNNLSSEKNV